MDKKTDKNEVNEEASRAFMDALTASDEQHRTVMRRVAELREAAEKKREQGQ